MDMNFDLGYFCYIFVAKLGLEYPNCACRRILVILFYILKSKEDDDDVFFACVLKMLMLYRGTVCEALIFVGSHCRNIPQSVAQLGLPPHLLAVLFVC